MTAHFQDAAIVSGDTRILRFRVRDQAGAPLVLTGLQSARWACVRKRADGTYPPPPALIKTLGSGVAVTDAAAGVIEVTLSAADTSALPGGRYHHELEIVGAAGDVTTLATGTLTISDDLLV